MPERSAGQRLADSVGLTLSARAAMLATPLVLSLGGWFLSDLIQSQREAVKDVASHIENVAAAGVALDKRVTAIEAARDVASKNAEDSRLAILAKLDELSRGQSLQSAGIATVGAKVDALKDRLDARQDRLGLNGPR